MPEIYLAGILKNLDTGKFHPIAFRMSPRPSSNPNDDVQRYKSACHHTQGFNTIEEGRVFIKNQSQWKDTGTVWNWTPDGKDDIPAMIWEFSTDYLLS